MLLADRLEVWNSGELPPQFTLEKLRVPHHSVLHNPWLARSMYLVEYIERMGTHTLDMIKCCVKAGLQETKFSVAARVTGVESPESTNGWATVNK